MINRSGCELVHVILQGVSGEEEDQQLPSSSWTACSDSQICVIGVAASPCHAGLLGCEMSVVV